MQLNNRSASISIVALYMALLGLGCVVTMTGCADAHSGVPVAGGDASTLPVVEFVDIPMPVFPSEEPGEAEKIEAALIEQGYYRDDVPLTYELQDYLHSAADEFGVGYELMLGLIERETQFNNISGDGGDSQGFCQIQKRWWQGLMDEIGADDLNDPQDNFRTAAAILAQLTAHYGTVEDALTAYNSGRPGASKYSAAVLEMAEKWRETD